MMTSHAARRLGVISLLWVSGTFAWAQDGALAVGTAAPDFALPFLQGKYMKLSRGYGERVTVLSLSRLSSTPCRTTMAELQKLQQQYRGDRVGIYLVNLDGEKSRASALAAVKQLGLTYPVLMDDGYALPQPYRVRTVPHLLVVDQDGIIRFSQAGSGANLLARLKAAVEQYRPPKLPRLLDLEGLGCATCKPMPLLLAAIQQELAGKVRIDIRDYDPDLVEEYKLEMMPTQIFHDADGKEVYRHGGLMTRDEVLDQFRKMGVATE